ncbi:MAG: endonuclease/exonuclease/phosphatase family protein [Clostridia bacterium]|nr:endonuclease/exonuclease/phosphatase family protein [Clostridia bacterium]
MRLTTYNIQSGRDAWGQLHLDGTARAINALRPDICALNEVRVACEDSGRVDQCAYLGEKTAMHARFAKAIPMCGGEYGIALLSRYPISEFDVYPVEEVPPERREPGYYEPRVIYRAVTDTPEGKLAVFGSHFGLTRPERVNAVQLALALTAAETLPAVLAGDFNMEPDDKLICELEARLTNLGKGKTYFTHHTLALHGQIDYIFTGSGVKAFSCAPSFTTASDHLPLTAEITLRV